MLEIRVPDLHALTPPGVILRYVSLGLPSLKNVAWKWAACRRGPDFWIAKCFGLVPMQLTFDGRVFRCNASVIYVPGAPAEPTCNRTDSVRQSSDLPQHSQCHNTRHVAEVQVRSQHALD